MVKNDIFPDLELEADEEVMAETLEELSNGRGEDDE